MSEGEDSSGEECSLRIDTDRRTNTSDKPKGRGGRARPRGRGRGKGGGAKESSEPEAALKPGDVVWAKVTGFNFWPGKVLLILKHFLKLVPVLCMPVPPPPTVSFHYSVMVQLFADDNIVIHSERIIEEIEAPGF